MPSTPQARRWLLLAGSVPALAAAFFLMTLQPAQAQPGPALDPPGRVARLNLAEGAVSFAPAEADVNGWTPAQLNRPLTSGDRLWTGARARSELHIGSTAVRMSEQTSLDFLALDDDTVQLRLAQGSLNLRVRTLFEGQRIEVNTPNLAFVITQPGVYRIDASPVSNTTRVVALSGGGVMYGEGVEPVTLGSQQQANFTGTQLVPAGPGPSVQDSFDAWAADRDRREDRSVSARYVPREIVGYQQLDNYGDWRQDPSYGAVWLPRAVPVNWAPYREGHWSWISPWGWTWVDDAPWGFAPSHYGRWAQIGPRWGWVPGRLAARPVYAPALVAFIGGHSGGVNWNISIGSGGASRPSLGWFPLAPGEAFRPAYRASPRYLTQVNQNIVVVNNTTHIYRYQRQPGAVTVVSRDDFARGRPVRGDRHALNAADLGRAQVLQDGSDIPQRPELRERSRPAALAGLPPPAVVNRPVVRDERREDRREERRDARRDATDERDPRGARNGRDEQRQDRRANSRGPGTEPAAPPSPAAAAGLPGAAAIGRIPQTPPQDRGAPDADNRNRRDPQRQQDAAARQPEPPRQPAEESRGQRVLREQAQRDGGSPPPLVTQPGQDNRAAERAQQAAQQNGQRQQEQAQRAQEQQARQQRDQQEQHSRQQAQQQQAQQAQQAQQMQQRAQHEQVQRQQATQQNAQRQQDQAQRAQEQQQARQQRDQQEQHNRQQAQQQQAQQAQQGQQQRAMQEQAQRQQAAQQNAQRQQEQQARQQQAQQAQQMQQQQRAQQEQVQRQQSQQQNQQRAEERQRQRQPEAAPPPQPRADGAPPRQPENRGNRDGRDRREPG